MVNWLSRKLREHKEDVEVMQKWMDEKHIEYMKKIVMALQHENQVKNIPIQTLINTIVKTTSAKKQSGIDDWVKLLMDNEFIDCTDDGMVWCITEKGLRACGEKTI